MGVETTSPVLSKPENCCGMKEYDVRYLVQDIAAAIEYLHGNRIIHRDLKPENIVLHQFDDRIVYKLIDLGYAKELDQGSVCTSFVGTLQYLAPELFASQRYQCTVDYWSFGTVVFECIVGYRPFLPNVPPVRWHKEVSTKSPDDITAQFDSKGEVKFSKRLLSPNHLSRTLKGYFEHWLRLMLRWDPNQRGGGIVPETNRPKCFNVLEHILALKLSNANRSCFPMLDSQYPVTEQHTMLDLQRIIEQETRIPINEQDILLASGSCPTPTGPASPRVGLKYQYPNIEEEWVVFLFRKMEPFPIPRKPKQLPPLVQLIVKQPTTLLPGNEQRKAWAHAVYFCQEQNTEYKRLILGQRAAMLNLLRTNSQFLKLKSKMSSDIGQLLAQKDHFKQSLDFDVAQYKEQAQSGGISSARMYAKWMKTYEDIETFTELKDRVNRLDQHCTALQTKIVELQRSPFARMKQNDALVESQEMARNLYQELITSSRGGIVCVAENRNNLLDHTKMVHEVVKCALQRDKSDKSVIVLYTHLGKISACRYELQKIIPDLEKCCEEIEAASRQLITHQQHRQQAIWKMLKLAVRLL
ncbi:inhibitor of nuclear factor kappa-B kinase subunit alpha-like [Gigantopelta aegis]|uniref:inhibitor of nuclear factor kappa-B kinase subunit alpha-like n=1 Tax=Gigantopelta aegis TaxID=1735272 RepID=UPI001B888F8F|nr:inhibitor of nuclear factor kappa-B kinase subunit alpha-like [Gigantopelta aegis]